MLAPEYRLLGASCYKKFKLDITVMGHPHDRAPINNGSSTEWSPIQPVTLIQGINKIG